MKAATAVGWLRGLLPRGSLAAVVARGSSAGLVFLATVLWARALGPHEYGAYAIAIAFLQAVGTLAGLGVDVLASRELAVLIHTKDWPHFHGFLRWSSWVSAASSLAAAGIGAGLLVWNPMSWHEEARIAALWILLGLPAYVFLRLARGMFQAADRTARGVFWELTFWNGSLALAGFLAWTLLGEATARHAAWAHAATLATAAGIALASFSLLRWPAVAASGQRHAHWVRSGLGFAMLAGFSLLLQTADVLLLGAIGTNAQVGVYSIASRCALLVLMVLGPIQQVLGPRVAKAWYQGASGQAAAVARRAARLGILAGGAMFLFYALLAAPFLSLFGPGYPTAATALRILALGQLALVAWGPGQMVLSMTGGEKVAVALLALALALGLPASYLLFQWNGVDGMAWGRVASLAFVGTAAGVLAQRRVGHRIDPWVREPRA